MRNVDTTPHTVDVLIERNGTIAHWTTVHVDGKRGNTLGSAIVAPGRFVTQPGEYVVKVRLDNQITGSEFDLTSAADPGCYVIQLRIEQDETLTFGTMQNAYECQSPT